jgi:hypothetical protein
MQISYCATTANKTISELEDSLDALFPLLILRENLPPPGIRTLPRTRDLFKACIELTREKGLDSLHALMQGNPIEKLVTQSGGINYGKNKLRQTMVSSMGSRPQDTPLAAFAKQFLTCLDEQSIYQPLKTLVMDVPLFGDFSLPSFHSLKYESLPHVSPRLRRNRPKLTCMLASWGAPCSDS